MMPSVALIGPDGAGKTTITRMLQASGSVPFKYLYMGIDIPASNITLPGGRWIARRASSKDRRSEANGAGPGGQPAGTGSRRGGVRAFLRLGYRLADEWFRQLVSWSYQGRGFAVLHDRHFVFDFAPEIAGSRVPLDRRIHAWCLRHLYPRPDLVILLDAPGALLFARKGESTIEELERRRQGFRTIAARTSRFVTVDATRPLPVVYAEVERLITDLCAPSRRSLRRAGAGT
jgi:thymidylate kinase